jgi:acyl-CoA synthetase (AMP-forming)/AMP-acid ligase II/pimeloyl-ACP methyl ester carboxylesterase
MIHLTLEQRSMRKTAIHEKEHEPKGSSGGGPHPGPDPELYPFTNHYTPLNGHRYHYVDEGHGHPIVMVHGNPTWSFYYRNLIRALRRDYRAIAPDHIGMGLSDKPDDRHYAYTSEQRLRDLEAFIDMLGLKRFTLIGHDWGGIIGTCYAALHPERIAGMVMLNTAGFMWPVDKKLPLALFAARIPYASALFIRGLNVFAKGAIKIGMKRNRMPEKVARGYLYPYHSWETRRAVHRFIQDIPVKPRDNGYALGLHMESRLKLLREVPLLLGWGMKDFIFCRKILNEWIRHFPHAQVHPMDDAGHYVLEDAAEEIIPVIKQFVDDKVHHAQPPKDSSTPHRKEGFIPLNKRLLNITAKHPSRPVVIHMKTMRNDRGVYDAMTYEEVNRESNRIAHGLEKIGIKKGMHTVVMVTPGKEFFCLLAGIFKLGAIPVFVDPGMGVGNLKTCIEEAKPEAFIGIARAHAARILLGWAKSTNRINVVVGKNYFFGGHTFENVKRLGADTPYLSEELSPDAIQMIAFTSGNTGIPKGVIFTQRIFDAILTSLGRLISPRQTDVDLSTFPPFALMGPAMGVPAVIPDMDATRPGQADPRKLVTAIFEQQCTNMFASPALIEKIGRYCQEYKIKLPTLRCVFSAGAPARLDSLERFVKALNPGVEVIIPYGATEALPVSVIGSTELLEDTRDHSRNGGGVCVGRPIDGMDVAIIPISEEPIAQWSEALRLAPGQIGEITVKGPVVTTAYYKRDKQNRLAKIKDTDDGGIWHRMGDVGYFDDQGRLWMCGRKGHRVETADEILFSLPCEAIFNNYTDVFRSALVGVKKNGTVEPVIIIELEPGHPYSGAHRKSLTAALLKIAARHDHTRAIRTILYHPGFPVDVRHNAKIVREKLAVWAQKELS